MTALLTNIKIDRIEKLDLFRATFADLAGLFEQCHIKIRGSLADDALAFAKALFPDRAVFYQDLQEEDWVAATLEMIEAVSASSVFLYFEDHKLIAPLERLAFVLKEFESNQLDCLSYSFFRASQLDQNNLLPLAASKRSTYCEFSLSKSNLNYLSKISAGFYTFSLLSIASTSLLHALLLAENRRWKFYNRVLTWTVTKLFPYPGYRKFIHRINYWLKKLNVAFCLYPIDSPFNLEKMWFESTDSVFCNRKYGVLLEELFANYDDDNGAYGESLVKRGLYPFDASAEVKPGAPSSLPYKLFLNAGESFDCTYYSRRGRIARAPIVEARVLTGRASISYAGEEYALVAGGSKCFYSNLSPLIKGIENSEIQIRVFDEAFV